MMSSELKRRLSDAIKFQKTLALFACASNQHEADAAERAARRIMAHATSIP
jgi:hypothetical protein